MEHHFAHTLPARRRACRQDGETIIWDNPELRTTALFFLFFLFFFALSILPIMLMEGDWTYALLFLGGVASLTCLVCVPLFFLRARKLDDLLCGKTLLARWKYSPEEWRKYCESELRESAEEKKYLFFLVAGISLLIGGIFLIFDFENGIFVFAVLVLLNILIAFIAWIVPHMDFRRNISNPGEAYISAQGAYIGGFFHLWNFFGSHLDGVVLREGKNPRLEITYTTWSGKSESYTTVRIPIPKGEEKLAEKAAKQIMGAG